MSKIYPFGDPLFSFGKGETRKIREIEREIEIEREREIYPNGSKMEEVAKIHEKE